MHRRIWFSLYFTIVLHTVYCTVKTIVTVDRIEVCYIAENPPYKLYHFNLNRLPQNDFVIDLSAELLVDMYPNDLGIRFKIERCASKEALDTCENFSRYIPSIDACKFLMMNTLGFRKMLDSFTPPIRCPILKNNYTSHNLTYHVADYNIIQWNGYFWKVKANVFYLKNMVATICFDFLFKEMNV